MTNVTAITKQAPPLPATTADLLAARKITARRTINDYVDDIHVKLWENPEYRGFLNAIYDSEAVEGDTDIDDFKACELIRQYGKENAVLIVAKANLATIGHALRVVLRRYGMSRKERASMVNGTIVAGGE